MSGVSGVSLPDLKVVELERCRTMAERVRVRVREIFGLTVWAMLAEVWCVKKECAVVRGGALFRRLTVPFLFPRMGAGMRLLPGMGAGRRRWISRVTRRRCWGQQGQEGDPSQLELSTCQVKTVSSNRVPSLFFYPPRYMLSHFFLSRSHLGQKGLPGSGLVCVCVCPCR